MQTPSSPQPLKPALVSLLAIAFATFCPLYVLALWTLAPFTVMNLLPLQQHAQEEYPFLLLSSFVCAGFNGITVSLLLCWRMLKGRITLRRAHLAVLLFLLNATALTAATWLLGLLLVDHLRAGGFWMSVFAGYWAVAAPAVSTAFSVRIVRLVTRPVPPPIKRA